MPELPHGVHDLYLAPVALAVDARIDELGHLSLTELRETVAIQSDTADWTPELREDALLATIGHLVETHDWALKWDPRGLRLSHDSATLVLGIPSVFREFLAGRLGGDITSSRAGEC
jgi:hypothetical protein